MDVDFFDIESSEKDLYHWNNKPYQKNGTGIYLPQSDVISLHSGWSDMHFHLFDREKYILFINFYDIREGRITRVQSGESTVEFSMMMSNQIFNHLAGLKSIQILENFFNITYLPFVDSKVKFETGQYYCTLDIHLKEIFIQELLATFPSVMEPFINALAHKKAKKLFNFHVPCSLFMGDIAKSILQSLKKGREYLPLVDKDVEALIAHAVAYNMEMDLVSLDIGRIQLMNEVYNKIIADPANFPGIAELRRMTLMNTTTLNLQFKKLFNSTMKQCWIKYRLDKALYMVVHDRNKRIQDIGVSLGYSCFENFTKAFKAYHHHNPSYFRKDQGDFDSLFQANF